MSDLGMAFTSQLWMSLGQLLGTSIQHTTAYNPETKGMVEHFYRTLKAALMSAVVTQHGFRTFFGSFLAFE